MDKEEGVQGEGGWCKAIPLLPSFFPIFLGKQKDRAAGGMTGSADCHGLILSASGTDMPVPHKQ
ncbi:MAG: hypothetical protein Q4D50_11255 [Eubacteriales bacterium]|nr:hypothetical protein [Eubacteriales bacterium]